jgi:cell fate (sporulation/competence/biofilm development) regulator YmcA (YheA/YmcA/DUF963 family)
MNTLEKLRNRLEALPLIREGRQHEALYAEFQRKSALAGDHLARAADGVAHAPAVLPAPGYGTALKTLKSARNIAARLRVKLETEPGAIAEKTTEESFIRLFENAGSALKSCQTAWENQLQEKIKNWQAIAEVVAKLGEEEEAKSLKARSQQLKTAIDSLAAAKGRLPRSEQETTRVQRDLADLQEAVSQLGLDTPFGKFLQDAASPAGADLSAAQGEEVSRQIAGLKLAKVFRVRLSS